MYNVEKAAPRTSSAAHCPNGNERYYIDNALKKESDAQGSDKQKAPHDKGLLRLKGQNYLPGFDGAVARMRRMRLLIGFDEINSS